MSNFLAEAIDETSTTLKLLTVNEFAESGFVQVEDEVIAYTRGTDQTLLHLTRGANGTSAAAHDAGLEITIPTIVTVTSTLELMSEANRDLIAAPVEGSTIYNTTAHRINVYDGSTWQEVAWSADLV